MSPQGRHGGSLATPARAQYLELKRQHPDALLLFRMGDFYESFDGDAETCASLLGIALTSRPMGKEEGRIPLAGIPHQSLERHLERLVAAGQRVAIAEQVGPVGQGLVERRVVRVVTPGTVERGEALAGGGHNWLVALAADPRAAPDAPRYGLAACDVTTGELECSLVAGAELAGEWARLRPAEVVLAAGMERAPSTPQVTMRSERPARDFEPRRAAEALAERLGVASLDGYGLEGLEPAVGAAGALLAYLEDGWPQALPHLRAPRAVRAEEHMYLDAQTGRNLELFEGARGAGGSLVQALDRTLTAMGARLLRARLGRPLRLRREAEARLDEVEAFVRGACRGRSCGGRCVGQRTWSGCWGGCAPARPRRASCRRWARAWRGCRVRRSRRGRPGARPPRWRPLWPGRRRRRR